MTSQGFGSSAGRAGRNKPPPLQPLGIKALPLRTNQWRPGNMHVLVVCGADGKRPEADQAMFSDFMGICMTLCSLQTDLKRTGSFLSCYPLEDFFNTSGYNSIKWGGHDLNDAVFTYTKTQYINRSDKWFEHVDKKSIRSEALAWICKTAAIAEAGDSVNIYFQCHGGNSQDGFLALGDKRVPSSDIANLLKLFKAGVQVNCVGSHCYSGLLVDAIKATNPSSTWVAAASASDEMTFGALRSVSNRCRNFRFSAPYIQSLSKVNLPLHQQTVGGPILVSQHEAWLKDVLGKWVRGFSDSDLPPQTYNSNSTPADAGKLLEAMITRENVDVSKSLVKTHRRRRPEYPSLDPALVAAIRENQVFAGKTPEIQQKVKNLVTAVHAALAPEAFITHDDDIDAHLEMKKPIPDWHGLFKNLVWRVRQQSAIWDMFTHLVERGFIDISCLASPINYDDAHVSVSKVSAILLSLERLGPGNHNNGEFPGYYAFEMAHIWLAIMIIRGGCDKPDKMFSIIEWTGIFGDFDKNQFPTNPVYSCDRMAYTRGARKGTRFGEWLPQGLGNDRSTWANAIYQSMTRLWKVEKLWKEYNGFSQSEYLLEDEQDMYLRQNPQLEPGRKHSGSWQTGEPASPPLSGRAVRFKLGLASPTETIPAKSPPSFGQK